MVYELPQELPNDSKRIFGSRARSPVVRNLRRKNKGSQPAHGRSPCSEESSLEQWRWWQGAKEMPSHSPAALWFTNGLERKPWYPPRKLIQIPEFSRTFFRFFQDFLHQSSRTFQGLSMKFQDFPRLFKDLQWNSTTFHDFCGLVWIAITKFIFCEIKTYPAVYINNSSFYIKSKNKYLS